MLITGDNLDEIVKTKAELPKAFKMKDLGELKYFLGIKFARSEKRILMHQRKYALELISESRLGVAKPFHTPIDTSVKLTTREYDQHLKEIIAQQDKQTGKKIACVEDEVLQDSLVSWKSKKQSTITRSSAEEKYRSLTNTVFELTWLTDLIRDMGVQLKLHEQGAAIAEQGIAIAQLQSKNDKATPERPKGITEPRRDETRIVKSNGSVTGSSTEVLKMLETLAKRVDSMEKRVETYNSRVDQIPGASSILRGLDSKAFPS
ncbi:uncharacterized protein LOC132048809 [Lycium ferocissimum]|uniref:uncharacterized protein LOC132048809 n=1 Tax=Lycium ferocissimum TaxID=112874 RepID=UPI00281517D7|nr:uncharacterized protein LOC132048809 [Lycium ferocissimum]